MRTLNIGYSTVLEYFDFTWRSYLRNVEYEIWSTKFTHSFEFWLGNQHSLTDRKTAHKQVKGKVSVTLTTSLSLYLPNWYRHTTWRTTNQKIYWVPIGPLRPLGIFVLIDPRLCCCSHPPTESSCISTTVIILYPHHNSPISPPWQLSCLRNRPPVREVFPSYEVVAFQPQTVAPPHLVSVAIVTNLISSPNAPPDSTVFLDRYFTFSILPPPPSASVHRCSSLSIWTRSPAPLPEQSKTHPLSCVYDAVITCHHLHF